MRFVSDISSGVEPKRLNWKSDLLESVASSSGQAELARCMKLPKLTTDSLSQIRLTVQAEEHWLGLAGLDLNIWIDEHVLMPAGGGYFTSLYKALIRPSCPRKSRRYFCSIFSPSETALTPIKKKKSAHTTQNGHSLPGYIYVARTSHERSVSIWSMVSPV